MFNELRNKIKEELDKQDSIATEDRAISFPEGDETAPDAPESSPSEFDQKLIEELQLVPPKQERSQYGDALVQGTQVEQEHTANTELAAVIAENHIDEIPDYYDRLAAMEEEAKGESGEEVAEEMLEEEPEEEESSVEESSTNPRGLKRPKNGRGRNTGGCAIGGPGHGLGKGRGKGKNRLG